MAIARQPDGELSSASMEQVRPGTDVLRRDVGVAAFDLPPEYTATSLDLLRSVADEIRALKAINIKIATQRPDGNEFIWHVLLQLLAIGIGSLFGVFALLAWTAAKRANHIANRSQLVALQSNQLALMSYCQTVPGANHSDICALIQGIERSQIILLANETFGSSLYPAPSPGQGHERGRDQPLALDIGGKVGSIIGVVVGVFAVAATFYVEHRRYRGRKARIDCLQDQLQNKQS